MRKSDISQVFEMDDILTLFEYPEKTCDIFSVNLKYEGLKGQPFLPESRWVIPLPTVLGGPKKRGKQLGPPFTLAPGFPPCGPVSHVCAASVAKKNRG